MFSNPSSCEHLFVECNSDSVCERCQAPYVEQSQAQDPLAEIRKLPELDAPPPAWPGEAAGF